MTVLAVLGGASLSLVATPAAHAGPLVMSPGRLPSGNTLEGILIVGGLVVFLGLAFLLWAKVKVPGETELAKAKTGPDSGNVVTSSFGTIPTIGFDDIAGLDEVKEDLMDVVSYMRDPAPYERMGAKITKGILLSGPPGNAKTMLAKAFAKESGAAFFPTSGSQFTEIFVGAGAKNVRSIFERAAKEPRSVVFIDEIDAVGRKRTGGYGGNEERENTLNELLAQIDGFVERPNLVILAATNRADLLDEALMRPGRLSRHISIDHPNIKTRRKILDVHARNKPLADDVDLDAIAQRTVGMSGAGVSEVLNEAALLAVREHADSISMLHVTEGIERVALGPRKEHPLSDEQMRVIAYHESGHALMSYLNHRRFIKITITPRRNALGYVMEGEEEILPTRSDILRRIQVALGGRGSEEIVFGTMTTGAGQDMEMAARLVRMYVTRFGMGEHLYVLSDDAHVSSEYLSRLDRECNDLLARAYEETKAALESNRAMLDALAKELLQREVLDFEEAVSCMEATAARANAG